MNFGKSSINYYMSWYALRIAVDNGSPETHRILTVKISSVILTFVMATICQR